MTASGMPVAASRVRVAASPPAATQTVTASGRLTAGRRPALDGVRALAVGAVMIYHFGGGATSWLPGGFLGVDVFFVLSGYLITGLLLAEFARTGRIDLPGFWVRRARRLVPALVPMLLAVCAWVWWATPLEDYPARRSDILWTVGYLANWHQIDAAEDYFAAYSTASPLRHTWSLAIEEQFYLLWPLVLGGLLWLGYRLAGRYQQVPPARLLPASVARHLPAAPSRHRLAPAVVTAVAGIVLSALAMAATYDPAYPATAYYRTQDRVQELFVGVLLALLINGWRRRAGQPATAAATTRTTTTTATTTTATTTTATTTTATTTTATTAPAMATSAAHGHRARWTSRRATPAAGIALALLVGAFVWMSDSGPLYYRGGALAISVLVAFVIADLDLFADSLLARAFSWRPAVALGRISYGVYLWHWPIVLFIAIPAHQSGIAQVAWQGTRLGLTLLLATLSLRYLEQPVQQDRRWLSNRRRVLIAVVTSSAVVVAAAIQATALPGSLAQQLAVRSDRPCPGERIDRLLSCIGPAEADPATARPAVALLGDSTARSLGKGLDSWARSTGNTWLEAAWQRCTSTGLTVLGFTDVPDLPASTCAAQAPQVISKALSTYRPRVVLIVETWTSDHAILVNGVRAGFATPAHDTAVREGFTKLVDEIAGYGGRAVFVQLPPVGDSIGAQEAPDRPAGAHRPSANDTSQVAGYNAILEQVVAARPGDAQLLSMTDLICRPGNCPAVINGTLVRGDGTHYTVAFADELVPLLLARAGVK